MSFQVNYLVPFLLTNLLLNRLAEAPNGARGVNTSTWTPSNRPRSRAMGALLPDLDAESRRAFTAALRPGTPASSARSAMWAGPLPASARAGALGALPGGDVMVGVGIVTGPDAAEAVESALRSLRTAMGRLDSGRAYVNLADRPAEAANFYTPEAYSEPCGRPSTPTGSWRPITRSHPAQLRGRARAAPMADVTRRWRCDHGPSCR
jgi:hypothetical protein